MPAPLREVLLPSVDVDHVESPRRLVRAGVIGTLLLLAVVALWTAIAPLSGAVIAPGVVKVDMDRKTVQHQEGGIVGDILVRDGAQVKAGQTLIVLKDVRVDASNELVQTQLDAEVAKVARLEAERIWAPSVTFPDDLLGRRREPRVQELLDRETSLFRIRRQSYDAQVALIRSQILETQREIRARETQIKADAEAVRLQGEELDANRALLDQGFVSNARLLGLRRSLADFEARQGEHEAELAAARQKVGDLQLRAETLRSTFMQEAAAELRQTTAQVFDLQQRLRPAKDAEERQRITAPISGEVVGLKVTTIGAVVAPREPILDIVPQNADLIIEARLRPEDINYVKPGAEADVRLTAFRYRITPVVSGQVTYVSADRFEEPNRGLSYYVSHVRVTPEELKRAGDLRLQAGMPAEVFIKTASRNAIQYLLDPVTAFLQRSLREP